VDARACKPENDVTGRDAGAGEDARALDGTDAETGEVIVAWCVHAGHFGSLSADQGAAGLAATRGNAGDHSLGDAKVELGAGEIVEEEKRLGTLDDEVVDAHCDKINADSVVPAKLDCKLELGADAVIGGDEQGVVIARRLQIEEAAEAAKLGIGAGARGRSCKRADCLDQRIAGGNRDAGIGISERLLCHNQRD
jgi:hypothetical protein